MFRSPLSLLTSLLAVSASLVSAITTPPSGALIVRQSGTKAGEYKTVSAAVVAAGTGTNPVTIFVYPGTYNEQVYVTRPGKLSMYGYSASDSTFDKNQVLITFSLDATTAGSDDASGTLRVRKNDFSMYNIDVRNSYGTAASHLQAIALSAYGERQQYLACSFIGYQDTILTNTGTHFFSGCLIEGAVDFIFGASPGQLSSAWFSRSHIRSVGPGSITANGRMSDDAGVYVFDSCYIEQGANAASGTSGNVYLGRPWRAYSRVIYQFCSIAGHINPLGWDTWPSSTPDTSKVTYGEYQNKGDGASTAKRASFSKVLTRPWSIATVLGSGYASWVDAKFLA